MTVDVRFLDCAAAQDAGHSLVPAVVQDIDTLQVLMVGWMDAGAVEESRETGEVIFWSRSTREHEATRVASDRALELVELVPGCDADTLLVLARPAGPVVDEHGHSCFEVAPWSELHALAALIRERAEQRPDDSYAVRLFESGTDHVAEKVGEEGVQTAMAGVTRGDQELLDEAGNLIFHLLVLLEKRGLDLQEVEGMLHGRRG